MIKVENLWKVYPGGRSGGVTALGGVSFACRPGEVYGLLGPNGAGKTTALRILSTAIKPTRGSVRVMDIDLLARPGAVRRNIGFLSASTGIYDRLTPREFLRYFGRLFEIEDSRLETRIGELAERFQMMDFLDRPCGKLSQGMKQKAGIARTVLHDPDVLIFDEPTVGLDVLTSRGIVDFVRECREAGKTVIFSTHIMSEVRMLCDRLGVIHRGRLLFDGTLDDFRDRHGEDLEQAFVDLVQAETET